MTVHRQGSYAAAFSELAAAEKALDEALARVGAIPWTIHLDTHDERAIVAANQRCERARTALDDALGRPEECA